MRIVAGKYKSRIINAPVNDCTRPTSDKARQGIYNSLQFYIQGSTFLDLFAGSGAYGIEALSRGASFVTFIDQDNNAIKAIKDNVNSLKINQDEYEIIQNDYHIISTLNKKYDLIFFDPPYKLDCFNEIFSLIEDNNLLNDNGIIVYEYDKDVDLSFTNYFIKKYKYGIAYIYVLYKRK